MSPLAARFALQALPAVISAVPAFISAAIPLAAKTVETGLNLVSGLGEAVVHNVKSQGNLVNSLCNVLNAHADNVRNRHGEKKKKEEDELIPVPISMPCPTGDHCP
jgi:hypothetical protein